MLFCWFFEESWEVFFLFGGRPEMLRAEATWGHFSRHVAAKAENWKQCFRLHQTLLFRDLRGWFGTCWAVFFEIFSEMGLEMWFWEVFENLRVQPVAPMTSFGAHFRYKFCIDFEWVFNGKPNPEHGKRWGRLGQFWSPVNYNLQSTESILKDYRSLKVDQRHYK